MISDGCVTSTAKDYLYLTIAMTESRRTILIADDDPEDLELVEIALGKLEPGANLQKVTNGRAAVEYLVSQPHNKLPCLIILDYNMPELTGLEVLAHICNDDKFEKIPKIIFSTSSSPVHIEECMRKGASEYFVKPHTMSGFNDVAKKMLAYCNSTE